MPTGGRSWPRAAASRWRCGSGLPARALPRSRPRSCRSRRATKPTCTLSRPSLRRRAASAPACIFTPRPNSPARNCWRQASGRSSPSPACSATASARRCTIPNSRCWNGIAPTRPYETLMADCAALLAASAKTTGLKEWRYKNRICDPLAAPERLTVTAAFQKFADIDLMATLPRGQSGRCPACAGGARRRHPGRGRRHLVRHFQPRHQRAHRAEPRHRAADAADRIPAAGSGTGAARRRSARRRALRALRLRRRACQRLRRAHRPH